MTQKSLRKAAERGEEKSMRINESYRRPILPLESVGNYAIGHCFSRKFYKSLAFFAAYSSR